MRAFNLIALSLIIMAIAGAQQHNFNPVMVSHIETTFQKEGTIAATVGEMYNINLNLSIPQQTPYQNVSVSLQPGSSLEDAGGNKILLIAGESKTPAFSYSARADVSTSSRSIKSFNEAYSFGAEYQPYLRQTKHIIWSENLQEAAQNITAPYANDLDRLAALAIWVNEYVTYDLKEVGKNKDSLAVYADPIGVCVEYTNLFMAMSRSLGYPTRAVLGYVYSPTYGWQLHSWAEVYLGEWIGFDPTWLEAGYIDATHIPLYFSDDTELIEYANAYLTDAAAELAWQGRGSLGANTEDISIVNYKLSNISYELSANPSTLEIGGEGAILLSVNSPDYRAYSVQLAPCSADYDIVSLESNTYRTFLHPGLNNIAIPFKISSNLDEGYAYSCPITVGHDGGIDVLDISINGGEAAAGPSFDAVISYYSRGNYTVQLTAKKAGEVFIAQRYALQTISFGKGDVYDLELSAEGYSKDVLIYDASYSKLLRLKGGNAEQFVSNGFYALESLKFTDAVPYDKKGALDAKFRLNKNATYTAKVYIDGELEYFDKDSSPVYELNYTFPSLPYGRHNLLLIVDFGFDEYKQELGFNVFNPRISIEKVGDENNSYAFDVSGPYSSYAFYFDGKEIDPHKQRVVNEGVHNITVEWIDEAGYERTYSEQFAVGNAKTQTPAQLCPFILILLALSLILFYGRL